MQKSSVHNKIGSLIRMARESQRMSQIELAKKLGYSSPQFVSLFERGASKVPVETLGQILEILGLDERKFIKLLVTDFKKRILHEISTRVRRK
jgi:transcriptional regulator with XRE-family HTH domain